MKFTNWKKSSRSGTSGGNCVEVASVQYTQAVRDSKLGNTSPILAFDQLSWNGFLAKVKDGSLDR